MTEDSGVCYSFPYFFSKKGFLVEVKISAHIFLNLMNHSPIWRPGEWQGLEKAQRKYADNSFSAGTVLDLAVYQSQRIAMLAFLLFSDWEAS